MRLQISMRALEGKFCTNMANMEWHDIIGLTKDVLFDDRIPRFVLQCGPT